MLVYIKYLPDQIYNLHEVDNIIDLPNYNQITYIDCSGNQLSSLHDLPATLTYFDCYNNRSSYY